MKIPNKEYVVSNGNMIFGKVAIMKTQTWNVQIASIVFFFPDDHVHPTPPPLTTP